MQAAVRSYQQGIRDLVSSGRYDTRDDFTVVAQPFFEDTAIPRLVNSTPSLLGHEILRKGFFIEARDIKRRLLY